MLFIDWILLEENKKVKKFGFLRILFFNLVIVNFTIIKKLVKKRNKSDLQKLLTQ